MSPVITQYQDVAYDRLAEEARAAGLHLAWSSRISYSRLALAAAETVRINQPGSHQAFSAAIFRAYFAIGKDIGDWSVIAGCAEEAGIDSFVFKHEMTSGVADNELERTAHNNDRSAARFSPIFGDRRRPRMAVAPGDRSPSVTATVSP
jgi:predicted DsbA family dithiol-disulfide isomerase